MTNSEMLLTIFKDKRCLGIPWFADLSYYYSSLEKKGILQNKYFGEKGYLQFHKDLNAGICFYCTPPYSISYNNDIEYSEKVICNDIVITYKTPKGDITQISTYLPQTYTHAITKYFVENFSDLLVMKYIFENTLYCENYRGYSQVFNEWKEVGEAIAIPPVSVSPFQKLIARWAGLEKTIELMCDYDKDFDEIIYDIDKSQDSVFSIIANSNAQVIEFAENLASDITGKVLYEKYNSPCYKKNIKVLHNAGKFVSIHIDGFLKGCLPLLEGDGFDAAEAVTPAPFGDILAKDLRNIAGDNIVIWGGLPGALFSEQYSDELFKNYLYDILDTFKNDGKFVLGVADQVPPDGKESRILLVGECIKELNHTFVKQN